MKAALFAVAALLLAGPALGYIALGDNGMTTYDGRGREPNTIVFGNELLLQNAFDATANLAGSLLVGNWKPTPREPASPKKEVQLSCLNSTAPPPLNWPMWCPGKDAKIVDWTDNHGALHRQITMRPMANVTSTMVMWFGSTYLGGLLPPVVEFEGNLYNYYHLWHPLDHVEHAWALGPSIPPFQIGNMYTLIHERYRNPADWPYKTHYETNGWFFLQDPIGNMMRNRFYIVMPVLGLPSWNMIIELNDTPEGMVTEIEIILGVPPKGFDERDPGNGYLTAATLNELLVAPLVASQKGTPNFDAAVDSLTRHAIEEFGNLRFFVSVLYEKYNIMGKLGINWIPSPADWMQHARNTFQLDPPALSMYDALAAIAQLQIDKSNSTFANAVNSLVSASKSGFRSALDIADVVATAHSLVYTPASNFVTAAAREVNAAVGPQPELDISAQKLARAAVGGNPNAWGTPGTCPGSQATTTATARWGAAAAAATACWAAASTTCWAAAATTTGCWVPVSTACSAVVATAAMACWVVVSTACSAVVATAAMACWVVVSTACSAVVATASSAAAAATTACLLAAPALPVAATAACWVCSDLHPRQPADHLK